MINYSIVVAGQKFDTGARVVLWDEPGGFSFYKSGKYSSRKSDLTKLQTEVDSFILHHSVTYTAKSTYTGLLGRGLSVNFIIDDDSKDGIATIYQCLDVRDAGWSHSPMNFRGPGVEISYHPAIWDNPNYYSAANIKKHGVQPHPVVEDRIHGQKLKVNGPAESQVKACVALLHGISQAFPAMRMTFPRDAAGNIIKTVVPNPSGLLHHYNITKQKIDSAGMPNEELEKQLKIWNHLGL